jgi:hypothetical protein
MAALPARISRLWLASRPPVQLPGHGGPAPVQAPEELRYGALGRLQLVKDALHVLGPAGAPRYHLKLCPRGGYGGVVPPRRRLLPSHDA